MLLKIWQGAETDITPEPGAERRFAFKPPRKDSVKSRGFIRTRIEWREAECFAQFGWYRG
jgi:hypothetical protein